MAEPPSRDSIWVAEPLDVHANVSTLVVMPMNERDVTILLKNIVRGIEERVPSFAVAICPEPRYSSNELARALSVDLHSPQVHLFEVVLAWRHPFQIEHHVIVVRRNHDRGENSLLSTD